MKADDLFWRIAAKLAAEDPRIVEGTIMNGRCLRVGREFLALVDYRDSGLVVKLPRARVDESHCRRHRQAVRPGGSRVPRMGLRAGPERATLGGAPSRGRRVRDPLIDRHIALAPLAADIGGQ